MTQRDRLWYWLRIAAALVFLIAMIAIVDAASHGSFLEPSNIVRVLRQITYNCVLGIGQTFVIITSGIDLSVGFAGGVDRRRRGALRQLGAC